MESTNLIGIFLTGLLAGGLSCMAVQGGLLTAAMANFESSDKENEYKEQAKHGTFLPVFSFLLSKLIAYTIFGALLGLLGSAFQLSLAAKTILQFAVVIFMFGTALNILNVHPIFRYFVIQPPRFITKRIRKESKSHSIFAPAILGAVTVFIPCGTTQAMMALAIASGQAIYGAAIMFSFILGTSPVFFLLGYGITKLSATLQKEFMKFAAVAIILLAFYNLNGAISLTGSSLTFDNLTKTVWCTFSLCDENSADAQMPTQQATVTIEENGYSPNSFTVKTGSKVNLTLKNINGKGCTQAFTIPSLGIQKTVTAGGTDQIAFVAPNKPGDIPFMCSMGMYQGVIHVVKS